MKIHTLKRPLLALSLSLLLVACQSTPDSLSRSTAPAQNAAQPEGSALAKTVPGTQTPEFKPVSQPVSASSEAKLPVEPVVLQPTPGLKAKPELQAELKAEGSQIFLNMQLPSQSDFHTQAIDFASSTKVTATVTDTNGNIYKPVGADVNGQVAYPVSGNLSLTFNNVYPDRLLIAELTVSDTSGVQPQTELALAFSHLSGSTANILMNFATTPAGRAMKALLQADPTRARAIDLTALNTLCDTITGKSGVYPTLTYTTHPALVNVAQLATDLATQDPGSLLASTYRKTVGTVNVTLSGLALGSENVDLQVIDATSAIQTARTNGGPFAFSNVAPGSGLKVLVKNNSVGTTYTYTPSPATFTLAEGATQNVTITATPATPTITGLSTSTGTIGSSLTITGTNFHSSISGNVVKFGSTNATVTAASATSLTITVPTMAGTQNVTVSVGGQTNTGTHNFTVLPSVNSISSNPALLGASVTINGTAFDPTPANNTVKLGSTTLTVTGGTASSLNVTIPASGFSGQQTISVTVGTQTSPQTNNFNIRPTIASLSAANGKVGDTLTITGTGFDGTTASNNTVRFGSATATVTAATDTSLTVTVPSGAFGTSNVTVGVAGVTNTGTNNYDVIPVITGLSPGLGTVGSSITLTGTGFSTNPSSNTVKFGTTTATVTAATSTSLTVTVPNGFGSPNVTVKVGPQTNAETNSFIIVPAITSLNLTQVRVNGLLTITGTGFNNTAANNTVKFGTTTSNIRFASNTSITCYVPSFPLGSTLDVTVTTGGQTNSGIHNVSIVPGLDHLSNAYGLPAGGYQIILTGTYLTGATSVKFGSTNATSFTVNSDTQITATVPAGTGAQNVIVSTPGGDTPADRPFTYTTAFKNAPQGGTTTTYYGVGYGNGLYVAAGNSGRIETSPNGTEWTNMASSGYNTPEDVGFGNGLYLMVGGDGTGNAGVIYSSSDANAWTQRTTSVNKTLLAQAYGAGTHVVVGKEGVIASSPDGITWTNRTSGITTDLNEVIFANGKFVAVGADGKVLISTDGSTWTNNTITGNPTLNGVSYGASVYVAVGASGQIFTSPDGSTWTSRTSTTSVTLKAVTFGDSKFVAIGTDEAVQSSDGITWTSPSPLSLFAGPFNLVDIATNGESIVAVQSNSGRPGQFIFTKGF
ncbi:MAG: IPT/TIG domain-containing protein [Candidatus Sericytochromatia bacterium]|nr:IPT/TIG domain-containing protein [Candidatus Sericytochromatia bacterium]